MQSTRCPHCKNDRPTLLEALDPASVCWLCHVCAKTFVNPTLPGAAQVNR